MNKKVIQISTLLSLVTSVSASGKDESVCGVSCTTPTKSEDQYLFDEAKKAINTNYPNGLDVISGLNHKGFGPAQVLSWQIRLFEDTKELYPNNMRTLIFNSSS